MKQLNSSKSRINKFANKAAKDIGRAVVAIGALGAALGGLVVRETIQAEKAMAQLRATVKSTGGVAGFSADQLALMSEELQRNSTFADDVVQGMQSVLLTFTRLRGPEFVRAQTAILDISTLMGQDLKSAAVQVAKALNDPIANLGALGRVGIQFDETQKDLIKTFAQTNRIAEAQKIILAELETQFGGSAKAARDTLGGAFTQLKNATSDLLEQDALPGIRQNVEDLISVVNDPQTKAAFDAMFATIVAGATAAIDALNFLVFAVETVTQQSLRESEQLEKSLERAKERRDTLQASISQGTALGASTEFLQQFKTELEIINRDIENLTQRQLASFDRLANLPKPEPFTGAGIEGAPTDTGETEFFVDAQKAGEQFLEFQEQMRNRRILIEQEIQDAVLAGQEFTNARILELAHELAGQKLAFETEQALIRGETDKQTELEKQQERLATEQEFAQQLADQRIKIKDQEQQEIEALESDAADERFRTEQQLNLKIESMRRAAVNQALGFLQTLGQKSKAAALAAIVVEKAHAIANVIQQAGVGIQFWLARGNLPMVAFTKVVAAANIAAIAATGLAQARNVPGGGAPPGTAGGPPIFTQPGGLPQDESQATGFQAGAQTTVIVQGDIIGTEEFVTGTLVPLIRRAVDEGDEIIIGPTSRQREELVEGGLGGV